MRLDMVCIRIPSPVLFLSVAYDGPGTGEGSGAEEDGVGSAVGEVWISIRLHLRFEGKGFRR